ncbi:MAG: ATP-binding protein, partial [Deltaproteobacteria bacterium]|nr:ATP-binding protein [Deltaproteobacteria bacterium]
FDEIHKYRKWRNYLKGIYDEFKDEKKIMVTGSARLDLYRFGGDSLQGRYHYLRLHPFSAAELKIEKQKDLEMLLKLSGFPEPFLSGSEIQAKRWSREYRSRLIREDLTLLENILDLGTLELLMIRLPELVGSPLSIQSVCEDLQKSHRAISNWLFILEKLYGVFRISPFGPPKVRAVKKEQKPYCFDWSIVSNESFRFENLVAVHLLKWVHFIEDTQGRDMELRYFRDVDGREVDFVILEDRKPISFIECKWGDDEISKGFHYLKARFPKVESWQISMQGKKDYVSFDGIRVCHCLEFLKKLV